MNLLRYNINMVTDVKKLLTTQLISTSVDFMKNCLKNVCNVDF